MLRSILYIVMCMGIAHGEYMWCRADSASVQ